MLLICAGTNWACMPTYRRSSGIIQLKTELLGSSQIQAGKRWRNSAFRKIRASMSWSTASGSSSTAIRMLQLWTERPHPSRGSIFCLTMCLMKLERVNGRRGTSPSMLIYWENRLASPACGMGPQMKCMNHTHIGSYRMPSDNQGLMYMLCASQLVLSDQSTSPRLCS